MNIAVIVLDAALAALAMFSIANSKGQSRTFFAIAIAFEAALILSASSLLRVVLQ